MADRIEFVSNYSDRSTNQGFQFEFYCNRCGSGYRTPFKTWAVGAASAVLDTASGLFGGVFGSVASVGERVRSATWEKAHDEAFAAALEELRPSCSVHAALPGSVGRAAGTPNAGCARSALLTWAWRCRRLRRAARSRRCGHTRRWPRRTSGWVSRNGARLFAPVARTARPRSPSTPSSAQSVGPNSKPSNAANTAKRCSPLALNSARNVARGRVESRGRCYICLDGGVRCVIEFC